MSKKRRHTVAEKPKNARAVFKRVIRLVTAQRAAVGIIMFTVVAVAVLGTISPFILGRAVDLIMDGMSGAGLVVGTVIKVIGALLISYAIAAVFNYVQSYTLASLTQKIMYNMRRDIQLKLRRLPLQYFDGSSLGDILSRVTNDVDTVSTGLQQSLPDLMSATITLAATFIGMLIVNPKLTLVGLVTLPLSMIVSLLIMRGASGYFRGQQEWLGKVGGFIEEMFTGHEVIRAFNNEEVTVDKFKEINDQLYHNDRKAQFVSGMVMPISAFFSNIGYLAVVVFGGMMVATTPGVLSLGNLLAFIDLLRSFRRPIAQLSSMINQLQSTMAAAERVFSFLDEAEETADTLEPKTIQFPQGNVKLEHIMFGYSPENILINDLNLTVPSGEKVAIVGPTGAGKTTLVNLLLRFYDVQAGKILIDDVDIKEMQRPYLRSIFGMVLQDTWLFGGTIMENIRYGRLDATDDEVYEAARLAYADDFIKTQPEGYNIKISDDGGNISSGQRQLITIARAILSNPTILILDEATSLVDTRTEIMIQKAMEGLMAGRTSFVIAHRLSTIRDSHTILVLDHGDIVESGTHDQLLALNGFYTELYKSQLSGSSDDN